MLQVILNWLESAPTGWMVNKIKNNPAVHFGLLGASSFTAARSAPQIVLSLWQVQVSTMLGENASTRPPCEFSYSLSPSRSFSYHECEALLSRAFVLRRRTQRCLAYTPPFRRFAVANNGTTFVIQNARSAPNTKKASAPSNGNDDRTFAKSVNYMLKMKSIKWKVKERERQRATLAHRLQFLRTLGLTLSIRLVRRKKGEETQSVYRTVRLAKR